MYTKYIMSESKALKIYNMVLNHIVSKIGNDTTYNDTLDLLGKRLLGKEWSGVYAVDKVKFPGNTKYAVVNLDNSNEPGSHWTSWVKRSDGKIDFYDSFGRPAYKILNIKGKGKFNNSDLDKEQAIKENNCGQRSLSWLWVYKYFGRKIAMLI